MSDIKKTLKFNTRGKISTLIYEDIHCVVYDEEFDPRAPIHFKVVPKQCISYSCDPSGDDEKLIGHLVIVARNVATGKGLKNVFNIIVDEDKVTSRLKCLHVFGKSNQHNIWPNHLPSRL